MKSIEERLMSLEDDLAVRNLAAKFADAATIADHEEFKSFGNQIEFLRSTNRQIPRRPE